MCINCIIHLGLSVPTTFITGEVGADIVPMGTLPIVEISGWVGATGGGAFTALGN
jgi:hypothetical protein